MGRAVRVHRYRSRVSLFSFLSGFLYPARSQRLKGKSTYHHGLPTTRMIVGEIQKTGTRHVRRSGLRRRQAAVVSGPRTCQPLHPLASPDSNAKTSPQNQPGRRPILPGRTHFLPFPPPLPPNPLPSTDWLPPLTPNPLHITCLAV